MSLFQSLYFMSLVGGVAGLLSWGLSKLVSSLFRSAGAVDFVSAGLLGCLIGALSVAFADRWSGNRITARWVVSGALIGFCAGILGAVINLPIRAALVSQFPTLARTLAWMVVGSFVGFGLGMRWVQVNRARVAHAFTGGLCGGLVGGLLFATVGSSYPDFSEALGFILVGVGICFGVAFAPILLRQGLLQYVRSGDPKVQRKLGQNRKQWELQEGDVYVIGAQSPSYSDAKYTPDIEIYIPDATMAPRHARVFVKEGRHFLERHPAIHNQGGRYILRVRGQAISSALELRNTDEITVGRTTLRFTLRKKAG